MKTILSILFTMLTFSLFAQYPGDLDLSFNPGIGANDIVYTTAIQNDEKIIIGGAFTSYNGTTRNYIARLNSDGTLDSTFIVGTGANNSIFTTAIQSDGKIIIGGGFNSYNGTTINGIARLNTNGTLDSTFNIGGTGADNGIFTTAIQSDGKIIIGGDFSSYNGTTRNYIARLNSDGTLDSTFTVGTGTYNYVETTAIQSDGKIIIGGDFDTINGTAINRIARLNTNGTLDSTFTVGTGVNSSVLTTAIQNDGEIIIGGNFTTFNGTVLNHITRLNTDGTLDGTFIIGTGANNQVMTTAIQSNGKIIIGGDFTVYNGTLTTYIARLNTEGTLDSTFTVGTGGNFYITTTAIQSDGKIIIGGEFYNYNGTTRSHIARLYGLTPPCLPNTLSGTIYKGDTSATIDSGYVYLFRNNNTNTAMTLVDSVHFSTGGTYLFNSLDLSHTDTLLVLAVPDTSIHGYFPTYYGDTVRWIDAPPLIVTNCANNIDIHTRPVTTIPGNGTITGAAVRGTYQGAYRDKVHSPNDPLKGIHAHIIKRDASNLPVTFGIADNSGIFNIHNVPPGSYYLWVDIAGIPVDSLTLINDTIIILTNENINMDCIIADDMLIHRDSFPCMPTSIHSNDEGLKIKSIYPNPTTGALNIEYENPYTPIPLYPYTFSLHDLRGIEVFRSPVVATKPGINLVSLDISEVDAGFYFLEISNFKSRTGKVVARVVKME